MNKKKMQVALFGESGVGKTHFGGQLLSRIETEACNLKMEASPEDLSPFEEVRTQLNDGLPASHTPSSVYQESIWEVSTSHGELLDISWPDYGGEQVRQLIDSRRMRAEWWQRIQDADAWILMVRPKMAKQDADIFSKPLGDVRRPYPETEPTSRRSVQARLVELLQMLLHSLQSKTKRNPPPLIILLSCWDELDISEGKKPAAELKARLPLLSSFVGSRWGQTNSAIFGLSALGMALSLDKANESFVSLGPEHFGYVVTPEGEIDNDLTLPIIFATKMATK